MYTEMITRKTKKKFLGSFLVFAFLYITFFQT